jgi:hypothetical protein
MYYPKNKIIEDLNAPEGEFVLKDSLKAYKGKYFSAYDGKYFTGPTYTGDNKEIIKLDLSSPSLNSEQHKYNFITNKDKKNINYSPIFNPTLPTADEYDDGYMYRYFINRVNSSTKDIIEINLAQYDYFSKNVLYCHTKMMWRISRYSIEDVIYFNRQSIKSSERTIPGITEYLQNPIQYYKNIL